MRGIQLIPQLVPKQFNTLPTQYRLNEHPHEEVWCQKKYLWNTPYFPVCLNKDFAWFCLFIYREINLYQSFYWSFLILCINNIDIHVLSMCMKKCHAKKLFLLNNCISNLAILILVFITARGVSDKHCVLSFLHYFWNDPRINVILVL